MHTSKPLPGSMLGRRCYGSKEYRSKVHRPHKSKVNQKVLVEEIADDGQHDDEVLWSPDKDNPECVNEDATVCVGKRIRGGS